MIPFPDEAALPQPLQDELGKRRHLNVFRMLMHSPGVAPGFLAMTDALRFHNSLPADLMELAILRVGRARCTPLPVPQGTGTTRGSFGPGI